jgi:hypothetical protein
MANEREPVKPARYIPPNEHEPVDPALERIVRAHSSESPPEHVDRAILAAAHRAVGSAPISKKQADTFRRSRPWWPLAIAATLGAVAFGVMQLAPQEQDATRSAVSDTPRDVDSMRQRMQTAAKETSNAPVSKVEPANEPTKESAAAAGKVEAAKTKADVERSGAIAGSGGSAPSDSSTNKLRAESGEPHDLRSALEARRKQAEVTSRASSSASAPAPAVPAAASPAPAPAAPVATATAPAPAGAPAAASEPQPFPAQRAADADKLEQYKAPAERERLATDQPKTQGGVVREAAPALAAKPAATPIARESQSAMQDKVASTSVARDVGAATTVLPAPMPQSPPVSGATAPAPRPSAPAGAAAPPPAPALAKRAPQQRADDSFAEQKKDEFAQSPPSYQSPPSSQAQAAPQRQEAARQSAAANATAGVMSSRTYVERIKQLRAQGNDEEAARVLVEFRGVYPDADSRLPPELRAWAASVKR